MTGRGVQITLSQTELLTAGMQGLFRRLKAIEKQRDNQGVPFNQLWESDIIGSMGEMVIAKWLDKFWSPQVGELDSETGDVAGLQVRTTGYRDGHLWMSKHDNPDHIFVLVRGDNSVKQSWWIVGWVYGHEGKKEEYWSSKLRNRYAYWIPQSVLHPIEHIPTINNYDDIWADI